MSDIDIVSFYDNNDLKPYFYHDKCDKYDYLIIILSLEIEIS